MAEYREPPRWLTVSRALAGYCGYALGGVLFLALVLPLSLVLGISRLIRSGFLRSVLRLYCAALTRVYLPALGLYRIVEISGYERSRVHQPAVFVANHRGRLDGPLLLGIIHNTGVLMKQRYARQPVYSSFVKYLDFVSVDTGSLDALSGALQRCRELVAGGRNLLVFPEGTRASTGKLLPFKDLAFRVAIDANVAVVPVAVHSDLPFMAKIKGSHFPRRPFAYRVRFLQPMRRGDAETAAEYADRARRALVDEIAACDKGTTWEGLSERGS